MCFGAECLTSVSSMHAGFHKLSRYYVQCLFQLISKLQYSGPRSRTANGLDLGPLPGD